MDKVALVQILDSDGQLRWSQPVHRWPWRVGRACDCDLTLEDPYVAPVHLTLDCHDGQLRAAVGDTVNGARCGGRALVAGQEALFGSGDDWVIGRTRLRVRLPGEALAPELPLPRPRHQPVRQTWAWIAALLLWTLWQHYLDTGPGELIEGFALSLLEWVPAVAGWCFLWAVGSKLFRQRFDFWTHLRIAVAALLLTDVVGNALNLLGFMSSVALFGHLRLPLQLALLAMALTLHLGAVLPQRRGVIRWSMAGLLLAGMFTVAAMHHRYTGRITFDLYHAVLAPPMLRLAPAVAPEALVRDLIPLREALDRLARDPSDGMLADEDEALD